MARKGLDEQAKEIEIKLMQLELAATRAGDLEHTVRASSALSVMRSKGKS